MTEIQEMAQAIYEKHKALWPLTWAVADFMAKQLAGDQGYLIVNQLTHELMGLSTKQAEIPTTKHKPHCLLLDPEEPQCHCSCGLEPAPAQDEQQPVVVPQCVRDWYDARASHVAAVDAYNARLAFVREYEPFGTSVNPEYQIMEAAERKARSLLGPMFTGLTEFFAAPIAQTAPQPEQDDSLNMEPEGANAYLVVDPEDNYHICYVVRSKDQALQHATGGLLAFGPITQGGNS